jgi:hypothetical protein
MNRKLPLPIAFTLIGALTGLMCGGFSQLFPALVGAATGLSVGCTFSTLIVCAPREVQADADAGEEKEKDEVPTQRSPEAAESLT